MKYLKEATLKTKAIYTIGMFVILASVYLAVNAKILLWISEAVTNWSHPMKYVNLIILGCIVNTVIAMIIPYFSSIGNHRIFTYLNDRFSEKILYGDYEMFTRWSPGEIISISESLWSITRYVTTSISIIRSVINFCITMIAIGMIDWKIVPPALVIYTIGGFLFHLQVKKWNELDERVDEIKKKRNREIDEVINGFTEVRSFYRAANAHKSSISGMNHSILNEIRKRLRVDMSSHALVGVLDTVVMIALLLYSLMQINCGTTIVTSATAMTVVMYGWRLIDPLVNTVDGLNELSMYKAPIPKFEKLMNYRNRVKDGSVRLDAFDREIRFSNVEFCYDKSSYILDGVDFTVKKGEHVGICGVTGGGKSTLLRLIPRFYDVTGGKITIDGVNIREFTLESVREHVGIVHQNPYIFDGTIRYNIKYAGSGRQIDSGLDVVTEEEMIEACKKAKIYDFIMSLPEKFDTQVGPRGLKLSGGQKQRIALARLFISNPDIIILDEATSALDNETEAFIQDSLNLFKDKTMIVVAHRLSTIRDSDKILVIDQHRVAEEGSHESLMRRNGIYAALYRKNNH